MSRKHISAVRPRSALQRRPGQRAPRSITLIVCEGETEEAYLEAARTHFDLTTAEVVIADNTKGSAPISVVNCAEERAHFICQQIMKALNPLKIDWEGTQYHIGASIGLAMREISMRDEKAWLEAADKACYFAKREGRGQLRIAGM